MGRSALAAVTGWTSLVRRRRPACPGPPALAGWPGPPALAGWPWAAGTRQPALARRDLFARLTCPERPADLPVRAALFRRGIPDSPPPSGILPPPPLPPPTFPP